MVYVPPLQGPLLLKQYILLACMSLSMGMCVCMCVSACMPTSPTLCLDHREKKKEEEREELWRNLDKLKMEYDSRVSRPS